MLYSLAVFLHTMYPEDFGFLRVFQYITFRAVMAAMTALLIGLGLGPFVIRRLTALKIGQPVRGYGMETPLYESENTHVNLVAMKNRDYQYFSGIQMHVDF